MSGNQSCKKGERGGKKGKKTEHLRGETLALKYFFLSPAVFMSPPSDVAREAPEGAANVGSAGGVDDRRLPCSGTPMQRTGNYVSCCLLIRHKLCYQLYTRCSMRQASVCPFVTQVTNICTLPKQTPKLLHSCCISPN